MENISRLLVNAKKWGVPKDVLIKIVLRDKTCVYCGKKMKLHLSSIGTPGDKKTIEHFSNNIYFEDKVGTKDVGICCGSCNSSKSNKTIFAWFKTNYCLDNNINEKNVSKPVKDYIIKAKRKK